MKYVYQPLFLLVFMGIAGFAAQSVAQTDPAWINDHVRINQVQVLGSHNSYKEAIDPSLMSILQDRVPSRARSLDYAHIPIPDQLDLGLRKLELDVLHDPEGGLYAKPYGLELIDDAGLPPGPAYDAGSMMAHPGFKVLHVQDIDFRSSCPTFKQCLQQIKTWSDAHPRHLPITITMNAKDDRIYLPGFTWPLSFDAAAFDALDAEIRAVLPASKLITPDDVRGSFETLEQAVLAGRWPTLGEARGRLLFVLDEGADKREDYIEGHPSLRGRVMFVNAEAGQPEAAFRIINDPIENGDTIRRLVQAGYLVRTRADAGTEEARSGDTTRREAAFASGAQFISTDYYQPNPAFGTTYQVTLPAGLVALCNPLNAPAECEHTALEQ